MSSIPSDLAQKLLNADMINLVKRVKSGGKLSREERAMLQALASGGKVVSGWADNYQVLAEALGVSVSGLKKWRKRGDAPKPAANGQHSIEAWRTYCMVNDLGGRTEPANMDETALRARKLLAETEDKELRVAIRKREWVRMDEVAEKWCSGVGQAVSLLRKKFENELPPILSGLDAPAIQIECRNAIDEVLSILHAGGVEESPFASLDEDAEETEPSGFTEPQPPE